MECKMCNGVFGTIIKDDLCTFCLEVGEGLSPENDTSRYNKDEKE